MKKNKPCDFFCVLGYGDCTRFMCNVTCLDVKCDGNMEKCRCPVKREKTRERILNRINGVKTKKGKTRK